MTDEAHEVRCSCWARPLLGRVLRDREGHWYLHIKVYRQRRVDAEVIADSGTVRVRCRACGRWHTVRIRHYSKAPDIREEPLPSNAFLP